MVNLLPSEVDSIAEACINAYTKLPKTGKPVANEWTVLSAIVQYNYKTKITEVVSLGTGSKCIGATKMSPKGDILNDSHAEVIARRAFLVYLYENIEKAIVNADSIFLRDQNKFTLKQDLCFVFYSSQLPCGDASILPKNNEEELFGELLNPLKRKNDDISEGTKFLKSGVSDIHRTGAKCLPGSQQDLKVTGKNYHILGQIRTKPGRGDRTLSVSCSDKIAKWIHIGIHGHLLDMLLKEPVYIKHFIFGAYDMPYSEESIVRAFLERTLDLKTRESLRSELNVSVPGFYQCSVKFPNVRNESCTRPAPGSIIWINTVNPLLEVAVLGRRLGATKKMTNPASVPCICKCMLLRRFFTVLNKCADLKKSVFMEEQSPEKCPYNKIKLLSKSYCNRWRLVKDVFFKTWTVKPDMWNFCVTSEF